VSEWAWVALGFGVAYGAMGSYALVLRQRLRSTGEQLRRAR
jgi:hypothetical protein